MPTPTTETEKSRAPLSAVTTGLTGRTMLFSAADAEIYQKHLARFFSKYSAVGDDENDLVQKIVDFEWRLLRSAPLEAAILHLDPDTPNAALPRPHFRRPSRTRVRTKTSHYQTNPPYTFFINRISPIKSTASKPGTSEAQAAEPNPPVNKPAPNRRETAPKPHNSVPPHPPFEVPSSYKEHACN